MYNANDFTLWGGWKSVKNPLNIPMRKSQCLEIFPARCFDEQKITTKRFNYAKWFFLGPGFLSSLPPSGHEGIGNHIVSMEEAGLPNIASFADYECVYNFYAGRNILNL